MVANIARSAAVLVFLSASGCGGGGETGTTSGAGGGGGGGGSGGGPPQAQYPFGLFLIESSVTDGFAQTFAKGAFQPKATPGCVVTNMGACQLNDCRKATMPALASGGKATVSGGDSPITLMESASNVYSYNSSATTWSAGAKLTLKAAGADVPAFSIDGQAPGILTLTKPSFDSQISIDRSQDLELVWSKATDAVQLILLDLPDQKLSLDCSFDGAAGKGTVPSAILGKIPTSPADDWSMVVHQTHDSVSTAGDWTVELNVTQIGKTSKGASTGGPVTLQ